jgi:hypothetical protein
MLELRRNQLPGAAESFACKVLAPIHRAAPGELKADRRSVPPRLPGPLDPPRVGRGVAGSNRPVPDAPHQMGLEEERYRGEGMRVSTTRSAA